MTTRTYSHLREHLAEVWNAVEETQEPVIVTRKGHADMALLPADELSSLRETVHLLRSPANARRLLAALARTEGRSQVETTLDALAASLGLEPAVNPDRAGR